MGIIQDVFHQEGLVSFLCQELHTKINSITLFWGERNRIERVFDIVYVRWGVLWRPLTLKIDLIHVIMYCICRLHNFQMTWPISQLLVLDVLE